MKSLAHGDVKAAIASVRSTKVRSTFTILGIIIGVVSVISIVSIGEGVKHQVSKQVEHLGRDLITIRPKQLNGVTQSGVNLLSNININGSLNASDVVTAQRSKGVRLATPLSIVTGVPSGELGPYKSGIVIGTTSDLPEALNQSMAYGAFFSPNDEGQYIAVLGQQAAKRLFSENVPLGQSIEFRGKSFVVRGVFNQFDAAPLSIDTDFNDAIFIPGGTAEALTNEKASVYEILARPQLSKQTDQVVAAIKEGLLKTHGGQKDFTVLKQNESLAATNNILDLMTRLIAGVAAISLLVGGIGVMNIMLVSVTERMHEIGIRKAVGATNRQILNQFVIESTVLSLAGGIIGVLVAFLIDIGVGLFTDLKPVINLWVVMLAFAVSLAVGVVFGAAPAIKAASKNPIDALRDQ